MRGLSHVVLVFTLLGAARPAVALASGDSAAADDHPSGAPRLAGFELSAALALGLPFGELTKDQEMSDGLSTELVPVMLGMGYRLNELVSVGGYFQFGFVAVHDCPAGVDCTAYDLRVGAELKLHAAARKNLSFWAGFGLGYEALYMSASLTYAGQTRETSVWVKGMEFLSARTGLDFRVNRGTTIGPFLGLTVAQYYSGSLALTSGEQTGSTNRDIPDDEQSLHGWLLMGVQGTWTM